MSNSKKYDILFLSVLLLFIILRAWYFIEIKKSDYSFYQMPAYTDMATFDRLAKDAVSGKGFNGVFDYSPLYLGFLVIIYYFFGHNLALVRIIQLLLLGGLNLILIWKISWFLFKDRRVALGALILAGLYSPFIIYGGVLLSENLLIFFSLLSIFYILKTNKEPKLSNLVLSGASLGAAAVTKPSVLTFVPFIFFFFLSRHGWHRSLKVFALICVFMLSVIAPCTLSNYLSCGKLVLIRSNGGITCYMGNNPYTDGSGYMADETRHFAAMEKKLKGKSFAERDGFYYKKSFEFIKNNPEKFLKLTFNKFLMFWSSEEIKNNIVLDCYRMMTVSVRLAFLNFGLILPFAVFGMLLCLKKMKEFFIVYFFIFSQMATTVAFHVIDRFRQHIAGLLLIFAAFFIVFLSDLFKENKKREFRIYLGLVLIMLLVFNQKQIQKKIYPLAHPDGTYFYKDNALLIADCRIFQGEINYWADFNKKENRLLKIFKIKVEPQKYKEAAIYFDAVVLPGAAVKFSLNGHVLIFANTSPTNLAGRQKLNVPPEYLRKGENNLILAAEPEKRFFIFIDEKFDYNRSAFWNGRNWDFDDLGSWSYLGNGEYRIFLELKK